MQRLAHTSILKSSYSLVIIALPEINTSLRVAGENLGTKEFDNIYQYHTRVIQHLAGLKAAAEASEKGKIAYHHFARITLFIKLSFNI